MKSASPAQVRTRIPDWTTVERVDTSERGSVESVSITITEHKGFEIQLTVASGEELGVDTVGTLLISGGSSNRLLHIGTSEVRSIGLGRVGIIPGGADIIWVKVGARIDDLVNIRVASVVCLFAGRVVASESSAFVDKRLALGCVGSVKRLVLSSSDELAVGVVVRKLNVGLVLDRLIVETIVDAKSNEVDLLTSNTAAVNGLVLGLNVVGKLGAVVTTVTFSEDTEIAALILRELCKERLKELPNKGSYNLVINKSSHRSGKNPVLPAVTVEVTVSVPYENPVPMGWST